MAQASNVRGNAKDPLIDECSDNGKSMHLTNNKNIKITKIGFLSVDRRKCIHPNNQFNKLKNSLFVMYI